MKIRSILALATVGPATLITAPASAVYTGLEVSLQQVSLQNGTLMNRFRVYATFSDPQDYLCIAYGNQTSPIRIESRNVTDTGVGSAFFNAITSHSTAPTALELCGGVDSGTNPIAPVPNAAYDTFFTVGVTNANDAPGHDDTMPSPNSPPWLPFVSSPTFSSVAAGWLLHGPMEQGRSGWTGDGDLPLRVLMMQLTVSSTSSVRGTVSVGGVNNTPLAGATSFDISGQTFGLIPGPGALGLLSVGLWTIGSGRRRRT